MIVFLQRLNKQKQSELTKKCNKKILFLGSNKFAKISTKKSNNGILKLVTTQDVFLGGNYLFSALSRSLRCLSHQALQQGQPYQKSYHLLWLLHRRYQS